MAGDDDIAKALSEAANAANAPPIRARADAHLDEWVAPDIADERGFLRAGKILAWMAVVGLLAASRHRRRPVATASVDGIGLLHPSRELDPGTTNAARGDTSDR